MKKTIGALMVAVSAVAFSANANATEYNPYVGLIILISTVSLKNTDRITMPVK